MLIVIICITIIANTIIAIIIIIIIVIVVVVVIIVVVVLQDMLCNNHLQESSMIYFPQFLELLPKNSSQISDDEHRYRRQFRLVVFYICLNYI